MAGKLVFVAGTMRLRAWRRPASGGGDRYRNRRRQIISITDNSHKPVPTALHPRSYTHMLTWSQPWAPLLNSRLLWRWCFHHTPRRSRLQQWATPWAWNHVQEYPVNWTCSETRWKTHFPTTTLSGNGLMLVWRRWYALLYSWSLGWVCSRLTSYHLILRLTIGAEHQRCHRQWHTGESRRRPKSQPSNGSSSCENEL